MYFCGDDSFQLQFRLTFLVWKPRYFIYPEIRQLFIKHNTNVSSSTLAERLFPFAGFIRCPDRATMSDTIFEKKFVINIFGVRGRLKNFPTVLKFKKNFEVFFKIALCNWNTQSDVYSSSRVSMYTNILYYNISIAIRVRPNPLNMQNNISCLNYERTQDTLWPNPFSYTV